LGGGGGRSNLKAFGGFDFIFLSFEGLDGGGV
jgi:hypothetical protein